MRPEVAKFRERTTGTIKLIAVNKMYRDIPFVTAPIWNEKRRKFGYGGQEDMSSVQLKSVPLVFESTGHYNVSHNEILNLSYPADKEKAAFLMFDQSPYVVASPRLVKQGETLFYIEDREVESQEISSNADNIMKSLMFIEKMKVDDIKDFCLLLGLSTGGSLSIMTGNLKALALKDPKKILDFKTSNYDEKLFVLKLLEKGILKKDKKNHIYDNANLIGRTIEETALFIRDRENEKVVDLWRKKLTGKVEPPKGSGTGENTGNTGGDE